MKIAYFLYTGYGKTKLMLDTLMNRQQFPTIPRTLLISTKNIVESSWQAEIDKWYPGQIKYTYITGSIKESKRVELLEQDTNILAMNTDMLDWYIKQTTDKYATKKTIHSDLINRFDFIIIDESSLFKSYKSQRFKLLKGWCSKVENVAILSATPTPKSIEDVWSQIYLLDGGERLEKSISKFRELYGTAIPCPNGFDRYAYSIKSTNYILNKIKDIVVSIPEPPKPLFPNPKITKVLIEPDPQIRDVLKRFKENNIVEINGMLLKADTKMQLMSKINQIASGDTYYRSQVVHLADRKIEYVKKYIQNKTTPILITYIYKFDMEKLLQLDGARLLKDKQDFIDWNDNKIKIGILSPFSAAHGLNLQYSNCQDLIWFSPIWDTEKWLQTNARICRRGQTREVSIKVLFLKESYDSYVFDLVQEKFKNEMLNLIKLS